MCMCIFIYIHIFVLNVQVDSMIYFTLETQEYAGTKFRDMPMISISFPTLVLMCIRFCYCLRGLRCQCGTNFGVISRMTVYDMFPLPNTMRCFSLKDLKGLGIIPFGLLHFFFETFSHAFLSFDLSSWSL